MSRRGTSGVTEDDHEGWGRPTRSRPRTKDRPDYSKAAIAIVVTVDRGRYRCRLEAGGGGALTATKARNLGRKGVIVGDRVRIVGDLTGEPGTPISS